MKFNMNRGNIKKILYPYIIKHMVYSLFVWYYIVDFSLLLLFIFIQFFGLYGMIKQNRRLIKIFIASLGLAFMIASIDYLTDTGYLSLLIFFLIQSVFTYLYLMTQKDQDENLSNIHYIPMPDESFNQNLNYLQQRRASDLRGFNYFPFK
ncbi:hypothetical protein SSS_08005 [Sarcoptes scabiei]|nr:hypothetical protein SSS_08005 [Sarcoptes scabiei]